MKAFHLVGPAPFYTNSFLLISDAGNAVVIDPAAEVQEYDKILKEHGGRLSLILCTHGHRYGVKSSDGALVERALKVNARILLYGHTHEPVTRYEDGLYIMNPGSARQGRYGMIDITPNGIACILCEL